MKSNGLRSHGFDAEASNISCSTASWGCEHKVRTIFCHRLRPSGTHEHETSVNLIGDAARADKAVRSTRRT